MSSHNRSDERSAGESEHEREARRIRETTSDSRHISQSPTANGEGESGTGDYGVELGAGGHRGFGADDDAADASSDDLGRLLEAAGLEASAIEVRIVDGTATLQGTVNDLQQKQRAEQIVRRAQGVDDVVNELVVRVAAPS